MTQLPAGGPHRLEYRPPPNACPPVGTPPLAGVARGPAASCRAPGPRCSARSCPQANVPNGALGPRSRPPPAKGGSTVIPKSRGPRGSGRPAVSGESEAAASSRRVLTLPCPRVPCRCPHQPNRRGAEASTDPSATGCRSPGGVVRTSLLCPTRTRSRGEGGPASQAGQGPPRWWGGQLSQTALAIPADWLCGSSLGRGRGRGRKTWAPASSTDPEDPTTLFLEGSVAPRRPRGP